MVWLVIVQADEQSNGMPAGRLQRERSLPHLPNLYQFGRLILWWTGRSPFDYINYGCFCGTGGGGYPRDAIDQ